MLSITKCELAPQTQTESRRLGRVLDPESGFTIIEVVVSALIVALLAIALTQALIGGVSSAGDEQNRALAAEIAQQDQERLRGFSATQLTGLNQTRTVSLNNVAFSVTSTASYLGTNGTSSCTSASAAYYKVTSSVTWASNRRPPVVIEGDITPPAGGTLLFQATDQTGAPLGGVTATASQTSGGSDYGTGTTSTAGCTVLSDLIAGTYNVTTSDPGYVDINGYSSPPGLSSSVTGVGVSYTSTHPVQLGLAGNISANFTTKATGNTVSCPASSGTCTNQQADALSWYGAGTSTQMSGFRSSTLSSPGTLVPASGTIALFPFYFSSGSPYNNNYQVWPGKCQQMQPPTGMNKISVSPGSVQNPIPGVQEPALNVVVQYNKATSYRYSPVWTRVAPAHVKLSYQSLTGTSCSDSWYVPVASDAATDANGSLANLGQPFATTATTGSTASVSGYTATYTVCADYNNYQQSVTGVTNNNYTTPTSVTVQINPYSSYSGTC